MIEQMEKEYATIPRDKYSLCRVGVDTRKWRPDRAGRPENPVPVILTVGRLFASKKHEQCVEAMKVLKDRGIAAKLKIGGEGPDRPMLEKLIKDLDVGDRVDMLGSLTEDRYLEEANNADMFILASHGEPMGVVYMEAQAMELPAIGCNALGAKELIVDGVTGLLVPPNSPPDIAKAFIKLIQNPELRRAMGVAGRKRALTEFESKIWAARLHEYLFKRMPPNYTPPSDEPASRPAPVLAEGVNV
jgi:glycosyltransferase involved in cell wall biosynthesis